MKAIKLIYLLVSLAGAAFLMNSCSSTQQFAGTYPQNNITGKGPGYGVIKNTNQPDNSSAVASANPKSVTNNDVQPVQALTDQPVAAQSQAATVTKHKLGKKIQARLTKYVMNFWAKHSMSAESNADNKETIANKVYSRIMQKYGVTSESLSAAYGGGGGLAGASRILAIVSLATGCAASLYYAGFFFAPAAIVTGALALVGIKQGGDGRKVFAIVGIVLGAFFMFFWLLWVIIFRGLFLI